MMYNHHVVVVVFVQKPDAEAFARAEMLPKPSARRRCFGLLAKLASKPNLERVASDNLASRQMRWPIPRLAGLIEQVRIIRKRHVSWAPKRNSVGRWRLDLNPGAAAGVVAIGPPSVMT